MEKEPKTESRPAQPLEVAQPAAGGTLEPARMTPPEKLEKWLWIDPLANDERVKAGSVLLDDVIRDYVRHGLLFEETTFEDGKLKGGSYTMTPAEDDAWRFEPGTKPRQADRKVQLEKARDHKGEYYIVPRNSLVYIKLKQRLRLPYYIIGRHNLKIRYVYQGLLLGTGPQVDPGFEGNLFIPLHNFTTSDVKVHIRESFVSIDFVRTTRFVDANEVNAKTLDDLREELKKKGRKFLEKSKLERRNLEDYLEGATPRSQMAQFEYDFEAMATKVSDELDSARRLATIERIVVVVGIIGIVFSALTYFRGFVADMKGEIERLKSAVPVTDVTSTKSAICGAELRSESNLKSLSNQVSGQITSVLATQATVASNVVALQKKLEEVDAQLRLNVNKTNASSGKGAASALPQ